MSRWFAAAVLAASLALAPQARSQDVSKDPARAPTGAYRLDTAHSQVLFSITHLGLTAYYGRFDKLSGTLTFDANEPEKSATAITIATDSVSTPSDRLDDVLKSSAVFSTGQFPDATFKSTAVVKTGPDTGRITGDLTLRGVTKPVTLDVTFNGSAPDPLRDAYALGFHATAVIRRKDFGITGMAWEPLVGDDVTLDIEALFEREKD